MSTRAMFKPLDGVLVAVVIATALFWSRCNRSACSVPENLRIIIAEKCDTLPLHTDTLIHYPHISIEIRDGTAAITESDCPTQQCVRTGFISTPGQMSACMPNETWIEILGSGEKLDAVTY